MNRQQYIRKDNIDRKALDHGLLVTSVALLFYVAYWYLGRPCFEDKAYSLFIVKLYYFLKSYVILFFLLFSIKSGLQVYFVAHNRVVQFFYALGALALAVLLQAGSLNYFRTSLESSIRYGSYFEYGGSWVVSCMDFRWEFLVLLAIAICVFLFITISNAVRWLKK